MLTWLLRKFFTAGSPHPKKIPVIARSEVEKFVAAAPPPTERKPDIVKKTYERDWSLASFTRSPLNVSGPFYTCGDCLACGLPECEAPDLLAPLENGNHTTYFIKQPGTADEVERACSAILVCCVSDLRYSGKDRAIIERLGNDPRWSDFIIRDGEVVPGTNHKLIT